MKCFLIMAFSLLSSFALAHETHADHPHKHGEKCGHVAEKHGDHTDYLHDGHKHKVHEGHNDECGKKENSEKSGKHG